MDSLKRAATSGGDELQSQQENILSRLDGGLALVDDLLMVTGARSAAPPDERRSLSPADLVTECLALVRSQLPTVSPEIEMIRGRHCDLGVLSHLLRYRQVICTLMRHVARRGQRVEVSVAATPRSDGSAQVEIKIAGGDSDPEGVAWEADRDLLALGRSMLPDPDGTLDQVGVATYSLLLRVPLAPRQTGHERAGNQPLLAGQHVLVVDDDPALRQGMVDLLKEKGAICDQARDGLQALEQCRVSRFALILMDLDLPNMDGTTATGILVANRLRLPAVPPIIALSGGSDPAAEQRVLAAGAVACLRKPIEREALHRLLSQILGQGEEPSRVPASAAQARFLPQRVEETIDLMGGGSEAMEVLQGLLDNYGREVPELVGEVRRIDGTEVGRPRLELVARTLASRSAALGLMAAASLALQIEAMAHSGRWEARRAASLIERFEAERQAGLEELRSFLQEGIIP